MATGDIFFKRPATLQVFARSVEETLKKMEQIRGVEPTPIYDTLVEEFWPRRWTTLDTTGEVRFLDESLH